MGVGYRFEHVEDSGAAFNVFPFQLTVPEDEVHRVSAFGRLTMPVSGPIGARAFLSPGYVNREIDGGELGVRGFLPDFGVGPLGRVISGALGDRDVDPDGSDFSGRTASVAGNVALYPFDRLSIHTGGVWTSESTLDGSHFDSRFGVLGLDFLLAKTPAWVVGPRVLAGERDRPFASISSVDQTFYSIGVELSASLLGADSLVVLRRRYQ